MRASRLLAAVIAAVICAGFVIGIRQARDVNELTSLLAREAVLTPSQQRTAATDLRSAGFAFPGQEVPILAVRVALREHHFSRGESMADAIARAEPDNLKGWFWLASAGLVAPDVPAAQRAARELMRLDPLGARPR